ncbi:MFS transporter [Paraburkholderia pallida]|uniref:MFS transporter n=1 Tax=Paraburkholderia pallida TaxID=2547399 RepID=A0A4P7DAD1_9BURK|nr:MFS transporter [Paraburkholderia pallida]QBR03692.1 MFS transporter [Paraburkholderia pallida]
MTTFKSELREGWRDIVGAGIGLGCGIGAYTPVSSLFFRALEHEFNWSRAAATASLIALPLTAAVLPIFGLVLDRIGVRRVALASALAITACYLGLSFMTGALLQFYILILLLNVLGAGTGPITYTRQIAARFQAGRGAALACALVGIAGAGMVLPAVLYHTLSAGGWRAGYSLMALLTLGGTVVALVCIGNRKADPGRSCLEEGGLSALQAAGTSAFWCLGVAIFLVSAATIGMVSQFQSLLIEKGFSPQRAAELLSVLAAAVLISRVIVGRTLDLGHPKQVAAAVLMLAALGAAMWIGRPGTAGAIIGVLLFGFAIGAELDLLSFFIAACFGLRRYGVIYGWLGAFFYTGMAAGGLGYAVLHDRTGSYQFAIYGSVALLVVSAGLFLTLKVRGTEENGTKTQIFSSANTALNTKESP